MQQKFNRRLRAAAIAALMMTTSGVAWAGGPCQSGPSGHIWQYGDPYDGYPMPRPGITAGYPKPSQTTSADGKTTVVVTAPSLFPESDPWDHPTNLLPTVYHDVYDSLCNLVPNTTPSTPEKPYNLIDTPVVSDIDKSSPYTDLFAIIQAFQSRDRDHDGDQTRIDQALVQRALDILEGNPIPGKNYSGLPVLHYKGPDKSQTVDPVTKNINVHQIWYRSHIEADTSTIDPMPVMDSTWTITYTVDVLDKGEDDFAPSTMYFDDPNAWGGLGTGAASMKPLIMEDLTFFPMKEGKRYVFKVHYAPGRYYNGNYTWGWRVHPGRVQFMENKNKVAPTVVDPNDPTANTKNLLQWEIDAFGEHPTATRQDTLNAIARIGNLAPEKRMWNAFMALKTNNVRSGPVADALVREIAESFDDWDHRGRLPRGVTADPTADITLFYANNTIYAHVKGYDNTNAHIEYTNWTTRSKGAHAKIQIINGDYFRRGYMSVDFGGMRGWENTFHNTVPVGGDGPWFTFGREHWWPNVNPVLIAAATPSNALAPLQISTEAMRRHPERELREAYEGVDMKNVGNLAVPSIPTANGDVLTEHWIDLTWQFDPTKRLRFYQFDPLHHDVAVFSIH